MQRPFAINRTGWVGLTTGGPKDRRTLKGPPRRGLLLQSLACLCVGFRCVFPHPGFEDKASPWGFFVHSAEEKTGCEKAEVKHVISVPIIGVRCPQHAICLGLDAPVKVQGPSA